MTDLTPTERAAESLLIRERRCSICVHRRLIGRYWGEEHWRCSKNLRWPKGDGVCHGLKVDEGQGDV